MSLGFANVQTGRPRAPSPVASRTGASGAAARVVVSPPARTPSVPAAPVVGIAPPRVVSAAVETGGTATDGGALPLLWRWNLACGLLHTFLAISTLSAGTLELRVPLYSTRVTFVDNVNASVGEPRFLLVPSYRRLEHCALPLTYWVALFFAVSAVAHVGSATAWRPAYERELLHCRCPSRWVEYALSAPIMMVAIAIGVGVREYSLLLCMFGLTATTMAFGFLTERAAEVGLDGQWTAPAHVRLVPHVLGYVPQTIAWVALLGGFYDDPAQAGSEPPAFVYAIVWTQVTLFASFGVVQVVQQLQPPAVYWKGELAYQALSLGSKATLGLLLLFNVLVLSSVDAAFGGTS